MEISPVRLNISYSVEQEIEYVTRIVKRIPWYLEQGYQLDKIKLPKGVTRDSSDEDVAQALHAEYSDTDYTACAERLQEEWEVYLPGFEQIRQEPSFHLEGEYNVVLTKYGMGGSYNTKTNSVIVRANTLIQGGTIGVIAHEIVHMTIQHLIDQYNVRHWRKERLVDLTIERYFPGLKQIQVEREDVSVVDQAFEKYFPDMEAVARAVGN